MVTFLAETFSDESCWFDDSNNYIPECIPRRRIAPYSMTSSGLYTDFWLSNQENMSGRKTLMDCDSGCRSVQYNEVQFTEMNLDGFSTSEALGRCCLIQPPKRRFATSHEAQKRSVRNLNSPTLKSRSKLSWVEVLKLVESTKSR
jgi:hypothetical protein